MIRRSLFASVLVAAILFAYDAGAQGIRDFGPHKLNQTMYYANGAGNDLDEDTRQQLVGQISQRLNVLDIPKLHIHTQFSYTLRFYWNAFEESAPFGDTTSETPDDGTVPVDDVRYTEGYNHNPELWLNWQPNKAVPFLGGNVKTLAAGYEHESTGESGILSNGWDRFNGRWEWESRAFGDYTFAVNGMFW